jgi:hypothetical protein
MDSQLNSPFNSADANLRDGTVERNIRDKQSSRGADSSKSVADLHPVSALKTVAII